MSHPGSLAGQSGGPGPPPPPPPPPGFGPLASGAAAAAPQGVGACGPGGGRPPSGPPGFGPLPTMPPSASTGGASAAAPPAASSVATNLSASWDTAASFHVVKNSDDNESLLVSGRSVFDNPAPPPGFKPTLLEPRAILAADGSAGYGGGEFIDTVFNVESAPVNRKGKWKYLWSELPSELQSQIQMDEIASFSVTRMRAADAISKELLKLEGITPESIITDATACVGGNTISFARFFRTVYAVELDAARLRMLKHNAEICISYQQQTCDTCHGLRATACECDTSFVPIFGSILPVEGDCLQLCPTLRQDLVFLDPPWGGKEYTKRDKVELFLSGEPIHKVCMKLCHFARWVTVKVPYNAELYGFMHLDPSQYKVSIKVVDKKVHLVVMELVRTLQGDQLAFLMQHGLKGNLA